MEKSANVDIEEKGTGDTDNSQEEGMIVLMKKIGAIRPMLLTTRRPSNRISGTSLKSEFKRTIFAI